MKKILTLIAISFSLQSYSQCFQIESILVDACDGSNEGKNEMVVFTIGSASLSISTLSVNWPNNSWLGVCQSSSTATSVALINSTILGCGLLKEPVGGVLRANSKVLLITSADFNPLAQSFVNLSDTLTVIFQCIGNTAGHFANFNSSSVPATALRTLSISFGGPCSDAVTYARNNLTQLNGTVGGQDGGTVEFDALGNATYINRGCTAPFIPLVVDAGTNKVLCINSTQTLIATTTGGSYTSINWSLGAGATGTFAPTNSLSTTYSPGAGDNGIIKLYSTIIKICASTTVTAKDSVNITVLKAPLPIISSTTNTLCTGQNVSLSYSLSNAASTGTTAAIWLPSNVTTTAFTTTVATVYTVQVTNACGFNTTTFTITPIASPTVSIIASGPTAFCLGGSVTFTANSNTSNYVWTGGATTQILSSNISQTVVVTSTNVCGSAQAIVIINVIPLPTVTISPSVIAICLGSSVTASANVNTPVTYTWSTTANTPTVSLNSANIYTVNVSNSCGAAQATVNVTSGSAPIIAAATSNSSLCASQSATLSFSGSTGTINWSNGAVTPTTSVNLPGIYTVTVTNGCGSATSSLTITSLPSPTLSVTPSLAIICDLVPITLTATSNVNNFEWSSGAIATNTISVNAQGIITVSVSNTCGSITRSITLTANAIPVLILTASSNSICPNQTATLTVLGGSAPYRWSGIVSTNSTIITNGGITTVSSTNVCGTGTQSINVIVINIAAGITASPTIGVKPLTVNFTNTSLGATSYIWDFENGTSSNAQTPPSQTYVSAGNYTVYLTASNSFCQDFTSVVIVVLNEEPTLVIPNVFTPNGDNVNELFKITGFNITDFNCAIFDRWGLKRFEWSDIKTGWNGFDATDGTYFFILNAKDINEKDIKKQGSFLLIR